NGGSIAANSLVTYTVSFSEDMDASSVSSADFSNAGSSSVSFGLIIESSSGVFSIPVTPTTPGSLQLQVPAGASMSDLAGNLLDTSVAITDDTILTVTAPDSTAPTLDGSDIVDNKGGGAVNANSVVTYAVTFSEDMDGATVDAADFGNAGSSTISIGTISETAPGVFSIEITPVGVGTLQLEVISGASMTDSSGNPLDSASAITDDTTLTVDAATTGPIAVASYVYGANAASQPQPTSWQNGTISDVGNVKLSDGQLATGSWNDGTHVGFRNDTDDGNPQPRVTFDLGGLYDVSTIEVFSNTAFAALDSVEVATSTDGTNFDPPTSSTLSFSSVSGDLTRATLDVSALGDATHYRLDFFENQQWSMINEIQFNGGPGGPDLTPPTLAGNNIVDDQDGGPVNENRLVSYTVTFSENIDEATVSAADFGNAGTSPISFGAISEITPGVFTVEVTPTAIGTLRLQVPIGATIMDPAGNPLDTDSAIVDDTTISVVVAPPDNTAPSPDPMSFASAPSASSVTSILMEATAASDVAGVEYYFTETSGNPGGDDSGWQAETIYEDRGLSTGMVYTYTVTARDLSANQNATAPSDPASATAQTPIVPPTITVPTSRHIVQRSASNVGSIGIEGSYSIGSPDSIEARTVVMSGGGNSGASTGWQLIDASPAGGNFAGTLSNVPAGGWYQLEVRSVTSGSPSSPTVLDKIGVGDIFVTAGQSNSANHSPGGYVPADDRVSARNAATGSTWVHASDPIPIASGGGGSVWPRLGDQLAATLDMPIGFIAVGVGGSQVSSWVPGAGNYNNRLRPAVQSLPADGFRAGLWHQGESDSIAGVSATTHASRLNSMISQSRIDAGWNIPWYICEASWHGSATHAKQEAVVAGQRLAVHGDPLTFLGETTDDMHIKGSGLHFDVPRQIERVQQYTEILTGTPATAPVNGNFEDNRSPAVTGLSPLADGGAELVVNTSSNAARPLGWRILSTGGQTAADGSNGFHNPTIGTYAGAIDSVNGGVLANMDGKHIALLDGGTADNYFLHSTRALAKPNTSYTLTVAIGVRDNPASFGTARLEITANGAVVANASFDKAAIDALRGGDASGTFTDASVSWTTGGTVAANQPLAIRVVKQGGAGTVLDFDQVRLIAAPTNGFNAWISEPGFGLDPADQGFTLDPDLDGLANGLEAWFGTHPGLPNEGLAAFSTDGTTTYFTHPQNASPPSDLSGFYEWSPDLADWYPSGSGPGGGPIVTFAPVTAGTTTTVTATASQSHTRLFVRAGVSMD
ncbi:MAG: hypothetical protein ACI9UA_003977, partial [Pseudoalteromonas tetraodonis]